jgi:hypothetical protein
VSAQGDAISRQAQSCSTVPLRRRESNPNFYRALSPDIKRRGEHLVIILLKEDTVAFRFKGPKRGSNPHRNLCPMQLRSIMTCEYRVAGFRASPHP